MSRAVRKLSSAEFLQMPAGCDRTELVDGEIVTKVQTLNFTTKAVIKTSSMVRKRQSWSSLSRMGGNLVLLQKLREVIS